MKNSLRGGAKTKLAKGDWIDGVKFVMTLRASKVQTVTTPLCLFTLAASKQTNFHLHINSMTWTNQFF
jgi:hypothetical protein